ncbi:protein of unknown function [Ruminococcaceae bacterium BL-6]|nr:protein of unknown function [Ruminococcaceae bacterium BL-6]
MSFFSVLPTIDTNSVAGTKQNAPHKSEVRFATALRRWWRRMDSDHRSYKATDLQSAPFGHSGTPPYQELCPKTKLF